VFVWKSVILSLTATLLIAEVSQAQPEARFQVVQTGIDSLKADLQYLVQLAPTPNLQKQWEANLEPLIDSFAEGLDPTKPIRLDFVFGKDIAYEMHYPIKSLKGNRGFIPNITGFGYDVKSLNETLYTVVDGGGGPKANKKPSYMRYVNGYASFADTQAAVPTTLPHPITDSEKGVQALLDKGYDITASLKNDAAGIAARRTNFQEFRKQIEAGQTARRNEDKNVFALRKLTVSHHLNEAERFLVETGNLLLGWTTSPAGSDTPGRGRAEFRLAALPDTSLFESTQVLAKKASYFANVQLNDKSAVSGKLNFALDAMRAGHLKEFYKAVRPVVDAQIDKRETLTTADQKKAVKDAANILIEMLEAGVELGTAELFLDLQPAGDGKHTFVCGVRAADGKKADEIIKLLPKITASREIKLDLEKIGDEVSVHSVTVPERRQAVFHKLFPGENVIYVATSKDAVWGAAGVNALEALKGVIAQAGGAAPETVDPRILYFTADVTRMVQLIDIVRPEPQKIDPKLSREEQQRIKQLQKDIETVRKLALDATAKCDPVFSGEIKRTGDEVEGSLEVSECLLKVVGSVVADFAKQFQ